MSKIGVDISATHMRLAWKGEVGEYSGKKRIHYATSTFQDLKPIIEEVQETGATTAFATGINKEQDHLLEPLAVYRLAGDRIENEIRIQAYGVRRLLKMMGKQDVKNFLLVSTGDKTSFVVVENNVVQRIAFLSSKTESPIPEIIILGKMSLTEHKQPIVFIGSMIAKSVEIEKLLEKEFETAIFPPHADFAGVLGALFYGK